MKKLTYIIIAIIIAGCGGGQTFKTSDGTVVTYHRKGEDVTPADSLISYFLLKCESAEGKVLIETTSDSPAPFDSTVLKREGAFFEVLSTMKVGDSVGYEMTAAQLFIDNLKGRLPDSVNSGDVIRVSASFLEQVTMEAYQRKALEVQRERMLAALDPTQMAIDGKIIDDYLAENNIEAQKTESGIRYVVQEQGSGPKLKLGQAARVNYAGRLLTGEYFDTSMEDVAKEQGLYNPARPYEPYAIRIYNSPVITGWHEGIYQLNEGSKATLYIPSPLAYGARDQSELIRANSVLVFDIEVVEVE